MGASSFTDACVDTMGVLAADVPGPVRAACKDWPGFTPPPRRPPPRRG
jgi:hypothetical protein